jgi:hypothetical protein
MWVETPCQSSQMPQWIQTYGHLRFISPCNRSSVMWTALGAWNGVCSRVIRLGRPRGVWRLDGHGCRQPATHIFVQHKGRRPGTDFQLVDTMQPMDAPGGLERRLFACDPTGQTPWRVAARWTRP